ncbi:MAG: MFS transporter [Cellulosilyticaceae bacterium]
MKSYNFYKWRTWAILAAAFLMALFHRSALGAIANDVTIALDLTASGLSTLASITFYTYAFMQIPAGILLDRFGYKKISLYGIALTGLGSIVFGFSSHFFAASIGRFFIGLGTSVIFISILKAQHVWFNADDFTKASSLLSFIGNIGGVFATFPLALLSLGIGWRPAMVLMGILCIVIALVILIFIKESPALLGFSAPNATTSIRPCLRKSLRQVLFLPQTWRNFLIMFCTVGATTTLTGLWGINFLEVTYGLSSTEASFYIAFIIYGLVIGSLFIHPIARLFDNRFYMYPRIACVIGIFVWTYILFIAKGKPPLGILIILFFILGFVAMSHILTFTDIYQYVGIENSGLASSVINCGEFLGSGVIAIFIGKMLDFTWSGNSALGIRIYDDHSFRIAFSIFLILSIVGFFSTFIGLHKHSQS